MRGCISACGAGGQSKAWGGAEQERRGTPVGRHEITLARAGGRQRLEQS